MWQPPLSVDAPSSPRPAKQREMKIKQMEQKQVRPAGFFFNLCVKKKEEKGKSSSAFSLASALSTAPVPTTAPAPSRLKRAWQPKHPGVLRRSVPHRKPPVKARGRTAALYGCEPRRPPASRPCPSRICVSTPQPSFLTPLRLNAAWKCFE